MADQIEKLCAFIEKKTEDVALIDTVRSKAPFFQRRAHVVLAMIAVAVVLIALVFGVDAVVSLVVMVYPLMQSVRCLRTAEQEKMVPVWLTYWVVVAFLSLLEVFFGFVVAFIPMYHLVKMAFLVWCMPPTQGAQLVFSRAAAPLFAKVDELLGIEPTTPVAKQAAAAAATALKNA